MSSFLLNSFTSFGVAAASGPVQVTRVALRTTTGTQDITISGFGTPKAARFIVTSAESNATETANFSISDGVTDGTNHWVSSAITVDTFANESARKRGGTTNVIALINDSGSVTIGAAFSAWVTDGVRINVTATNGQAKLVTVILVGGASTSCKVGTTTLATSGNVVTATPGFQINALMTGHTTELFNTNSANAVYGPGLASYDGSTIRQCSAIIGIVNSSAVGDPNATVRSTAVMTRNSAVNATIENITSTTFDIRSNNGSLNTSALGWLAINFGGSYSAWAGMLDSPTATGNHDHTGPSFTPSFSFMIPTMHTAVATTSTDSKAGTLGLAAMTSSDQYCVCMTDQDAAATIRAKSTSSAVAIDLNTDAGAAAFDATFGSWLSNGVRLNYSAVPGTARKWPSLFIG